MNETRKCDEETLDNADNREKSFTPEQVAAIRAGHHETFRELYYTYSDPIIAFLTKLLGSGESAKDVARETFATLWEHRDRIDPSKNIKGYLFIIARHASFRHIRRNSVYTVTGDNAESNGGKSGESDEEIIAHETRLLVEIAVSRMPELRRSIYEMSRDRGLTNAEIAGKLGISRESAASHLYNALNDIREVLGVATFVAAVGVMV